MGDVSPEQATNIWRQLRLFHMTTSALHAATKIPTFPPVSVRIAKEQTRGTLMHGPCDQDNLVQVLLVKLQLAEQKTLRGAAAREARPVPIPTGYVHLVGGPAMPGLIPIICRLKARISASRYGVLECGRSRVPGEHVQRLPRADEHLC